VKRFIGRPVNLWRNLVHPNRVDRDLDEELRAAFELLVEDRVRSGMPPDAAVAPPGWSGGARTP
jgi:hypothetical protein